MLGVEGLYRLRMAVIDALYLLERGYSRSVMTRVVGDRYGLERPLRSVLYRCVYPEAVARAIILKTCSPSGVEERWLNIDGLNVLGTLLSRLSGGLIIRSLDGLHRDVSEVHASLLRQRGIREAAAVLIEAIKSVKPRGVRILLEEQVSRSGDIATMLRRMIAEAGISGEVFTTRQVDSMLIRLPGITCSSDSVVASKCERIFDVPGYCIWVMGLASGAVLDLRRIPSSDWWCDDYLP